MFSSFGIGRASSLLADDDLVIYFSDLKEPLQRLAAELDRTIEIFGSVSRQGHGNDLDIIVVGTEEEWEQFRSEVMEDPLPNAYTRAEVARKVLGTDYVRFEDNMPLLGLVDIFIFPPQWRKRLDELQTAFPHDDPDFMVNIVEDATPLSDVLF